MIWHAVNYQKFMFIVLDDARNILIVVLIITLKMTIIRIEKEPNDCHYNHPMKIHLYLLNRKNQKHLIHLMQLQLFHISWQ